MISSFGERGSRTALSLDLFLHAAKSEILIENAYFLPNDTTIDLLKKAVERGVKVEIIVPGRKNNLWFVRRASRALYGKLLLAGVKIYEYRPTMMHAKTMVVDHRWSSIGSSNIDNRSFFLNDEANVNVRSEAIAAELEAMFARDKGKSAEITYEKWKSRSLYQKIVEKFFGLFQDQF
jgi:cardiolipin synthase